MNSLLMDRHAFFIHVKTHYTAPRINTHSEGVLTARFDLLATNLGRVTSPLFGTNSAKSSGIPAHSVLNT